MGSRERPFRSVTPGAEADARFRRAFGDGGLERIQVAHLDPAGAWLAHYVGPPERPGAASLPLRQIVADGLAIGAAGWLIAHNHPSGDLAPSAADLQLTRRIQGLGLILGIWLVDHLIYTASGCLSFRQEGLL